MTLALAAILMLLVMRWPTHLIRRVIELLASELYRKEPAIGPVQPSEDVWYKAGTLSGESARIIWLILSESPEFSADVINWGRRVDLRENNWSLKELRDSLREWWPQNERFFKERNYKA